MIVFPKWKQLKLRFGLSQDCAVDVIREIQERRGLMVDKEHFDYTMNEIRKNRGLYQMANEELAKEMFPYIQQIFPQARLIQCGIYQWIAADLKALIRLDKDLGNMKAEKEKELEEINNAIAQL